MTRATSDPVLSDSEGAMDNRYLDPLVTVPEPAQGSFLSPGFDYALHYPDTGCVAAPKCLECPLAVCFHDDPGDYQRSKRMTRDLQVAKAIQDGLTVDAAADRFSVTVRTVFRVLSRVRAAGYFLRALQQPSRISVDLQMSMAITDRGLSIEETASEFSVTPRTVYRALRRVYDDHSC